VNPGRWLAISVVLNLGLAGILAARFLGTPTPAPASPATPAPVSKPVVKKVIETNDVVLPGTVTRQDWHAIESEDYKKYIANLRAIGCPEETIRDIIILDLNKQYIDRRRAAFPRKPFVYWDTSNALRGGRNTEEREREQSLLALDQEKRKLVRELLGVDLTEELAKYHMSNSRADLENMWTYLVPEKREAVRLLQSRYDEQVRLIRAKADPDGRLSPELQQQLKEAKARNEADLAQALAPAELEQYQLRMSGTASNLRLALSAFEPTEDEYQRLFPLRKAYDEIFSDPTFDRNDPEQLKVRTEAYAQMEEKMRGVLNPERYADYLRSRDKDYADAYQFVKLWELPKEMTIRLYEIKTKVDAQTREVTASTTLDAATRQEMLASIKTQGQTALKTALGERAYQGYLRRNRSLMF
jgi:hypothetical protein